MNGSNAYDISGAKNLRHILYKTYYIAIIIVVYIKFFYIILIKESGERRNTGNFFCPGRSKAQFTATDDFKKSVLAATLSDE